MRVLLCLLVVACCPPMWAADDIVIADFEGEDYGSWVVQGEAFGPGPARGTLPGQMPVSGFRGKGLVNSFYMGDRSTGTLTSPPFKVERDYITFLIGGGGYDGLTCLNLLRDGRVVRTATGPNTQPGGSEALELSYWDVKDLAGQQVVLQIVDQATGGWGHINVDYVVQTNDKPNAAVRKAHRRDFTIRAPYLLIPIQNGARKCTVILEVEGRPVRRYDAELAPNADSIDWYAFLTVEEYQGQPATLKVDRATEAGFQLIQPSQTIPGSERWYSEPLRPQFHFSQKVGWNNDPNGMVYFQGEWHLYFQHNPVGWNWGNMTWGHAVSRDLVHWEQLPDALFPKTMARGDCFSGSAIVDVANSAGFRSGKEDVLVAFLTDTGAGEALAYSLDRGRTFTWYEGNPVVTHKGRDPKVIWYEPGRHWVMAVYDEHPEFGQNIAFYTSQDLKTWQEQSHLPGFFECPEILSLPVDGNEANTKWVVFAADAKYVIGSFDGKRFTPEHEGKHQVHYGDYYASQVFNQAPGGRRIQIGWARIPMPGMPFNQTFSFPHELTLRSTPRGVRLFAEPVREIDRLHRTRHARQDLTLRPDVPVDVPVGSDLLDLRVEFELGNASQVGLAFGDERVAYDVKTESVRGAKVFSQNGRIVLQVLVDRPMIEICGNRGEAYITAKREHHDAFDHVAFFAADGDARIVRCEIYELASIWTND